MVKLCYSVTANQVQTNKAAASYLVDFKRNN